MTYNGEVDAVGGVVMMLKGENSQQCGRKIKKNYPPYKKIFTRRCCDRTYLDRTDLVTEP